MILRRVLSCFFSLALSLVLLSQVPQGFNYQAIVRNPDGSVMINEIASIQIRIIDCMQHQVIPGHKGLLVHKVSPEIIGGMR